MARMIPDAFPPDTVSVAERVLFTALHTGLDDEYTVIHSLPWLDDTLRSLQEGECDFLVLHPALGMLAVETKSGGVHYDGPSRSWLRTDGSRLNKDPFLQAQQSVHTLTKLLRRDVPGYQQADPPFGHAVVFPDADQLRGTMPAHAKPDIILLKAELQQLQPKIEGILARYRKPSARMNNRLFQAVVERLLPEFQVIQSLAARFQDEDQELGRLTNQQIQLLNSMRRCPRLIIEGCAGSGKTLLALEKARRLAEDGRRVLLLCYNTLLADWLRARVLQLGLNIEVFRFHELCEHVVKATGGTFVIPDGDQSHFYDVTAAEMLLESIDDYPDRYDAIIVDEAQDFNTDWWIPIEHLLGNTEQGCFYIFHDPEQNIFKRENELPFSQPSMLLDVNCRNTNRIADYVNELANIDTHSAGFVADGISPVEHVVSSREEEVEVTGDTLQNLITQEQIDPQRIVIIGRYRFENSSFAGKSILNGIPIVDESTGTNHKDAVRYATLYRFKGLETDCAILTGFRRPKSEERARELYVAASRAKMLLHLMYLSDTATS